MEFFGAIFAFAGFLVCAVIWLLPIVLIAGSDRTTGGEKLAWILAVIFVTWFAWVFYLLLAPLKSPESDYRRRGSGYRRRDYGYRR
jgi:Na+/melibiose symporter-like transporter